MNDYVIPILTVFAALVGAIGFLAPIGKYWSRPPMGGVGVAIMAVAIIPMTTFKWGEVVLESSTMKMRIAELQAINDDLAATIERKDFALASLEEQVASSSVNFNPSTFDDLISHTSIQITDRQELANDMYSALVSAGYTVVPRESITRSIAAGLSANPADPWFDWDATAHIEDGSEDSSGMEKHEQENPLHAPHLPGSLPGERSLGPTQPSLQNLRSGD